MSASHHPSDALLTAYAAGTLAEGLALVVATHLSFCGRCCRHAREAEAVGGVLLDDLPPAEMAEDALERLMARLDEPGPGPAPPVSAGPADLPEPLRSYVGQAPAGSRWRRLAPGVRHFEVMPRTARGGTVRLLRLAPGVSVPHHGHAGTELTLILRGAYADAYGTFGPGDLAEHDEQDRHEPAVAGDEECLCLIATEAPLRFTGLVPRLMQPLFGI